jgi:hypothetical protein
LKQICSALPDGSRVSNPDNCQSYFECRNRRHTEIFCADSMSFDSNTNQCRDESSVNCVNKNGQQSEICRGQRNGQRFQNPLSCADYFECQNNQRIAKVCENGQLYNSQIGACSNQANVNCGSRRIPQNQYQNEGIQTPCSQPGEKNSTLMSLQIQLFLKFRNLHHTSSFALPINLLHLH